MKGLARGNRGLSMILHCPKNQPCRIRTEPLSQSQLPTRLLARESHHSALATPKAPSRTPVPGRRACAIRQSCTRDLLQTGPSAAPSRAAGGAAHLSDYEPGSLFPPASPHRNREQDKEQILFKMKQCRKKAHSSKQDEPRTLSLPDGGKIR